MLRKGGPFAFGPKWLIFMAELRKPQKIGNAYRILGKLVWMDAEFILVLNETKTCMNKQLLAVKSHFFEVYSKWPILAKMADFMAEIWKPQEIGNTHRILVKLV